MCLQASFGAQNALYARITRDCLSQRPGDRFERRLQNVMSVTPAQEIEV